MANVVGKVPVGADTRPLENDISAALSKNYQLKGLNEKAFSQPLGRITGAVDEFRKSLDASNARVLAFGASAGAIFAIQKGFENLVKTTINVQKNLTDINTILGLSAKNLSNFGDQLFKVAGQTGQSFETVSQAAVEFSRQGLGVEETLKRTRDALILTRLSGLDVVSSTQALTATINSFNKVALDSTQIVNKLATVDAAFAVSSADLADAISRVGSSADSVGVNLDQLVALVTSVQQTTARGGAVIGNSLKTIFTRLERTDVLDQLEALGIQARNVDGSFKPAIDTLTQLATTFDGLSDAQRANVAELVGGVFQINILKAALGDLGKQYSIYNSALNTSTNATDTAVKRNEQLNQTLAALINKTTTNFTKLAADVGGLTLAPAIEGVLGNINSALESFNLADAKGPGEKLAKGLLEGLGNYISGPGLALIGAVIGKLFINLAKFSGQAVGQILDINKGSQQQAQIQERINSILAQNPNLIQGILTKQISLLQVENQILSVIKAQTVAREQAGAVSASLTASLMGRGVTSVGGKISAKSGGFIPNFSSAEQAEVYGAYLGGYKPGAVSRMNIPGAGQVVYNKAEQVKQFPGMTQPAIMPPQASSAGKNYAQAFQSKLGFNPYAAMGYIPNFASTSDIIAAREAQTLKQINKTQWMIEGKEGIINSSVVQRALSSKRSQARILDASSIATMLVPPSGKTSNVKEKLTNLGGEDVLVRWPVKTYNQNYKDAGSILDIQKAIEQSVSQATSAFIKSINPPAVIPTPQSLTTKLDTTPGSKGAITAAAGAAFEVGLGLALGIPAAAREGINFDVIGSPNQKLAALFGYNTPLADFKINDNSRENINSMAEKIITASGVLPKSAFGKDGASVVGKYLSRKNAAKGFIPNYSPLMASMMREISSGVSPSSVRVGQDSRLSNSENPMGLGVYNTKDEPAGLGQGIARFKDLFAARKSGAAKGFIPNYATRAFDPDYRQKVLNSRGLTTGGNKVPFGQGGGALAGSILLPTITGAVSSAMSEENIVGRGISSGLGNIGSYALTGAALGGGAPGAIIGGLFGAATTLIDIQKQLDEKPFKDLEKAIQLSQEKLNSLNDSFIKFNGISEKLNQAYTGNIRLSTQELQKLQNAQVAALSSLPAETRNAILDALGKGDTLKVQQIQTDILETQQSKVQAQQAEKTAETLKLKEEPGFMDYFNTMSSKTFATPSEIRKQYLKTNPQEIQKELDSRQTELEQFGLQRLENGQMVGDVISKLSAGGAKPEEIKSKLLTLKSQFKNAALYAEYIKDFDIEKFLATLKEVKDTNEIREGNIQKVQDIAKAFLNGLENNIIETNRIFSEGETNIANVTAQIQSRRGTFLESIKDLFGEFTQLNVSQQFDDAIRNAEYERSRLQITQKATGNLNNLGGTEIANFRAIPGPNPEIVDFINKLETDVNKLKGITSFDELSKQAKELSQSYFENYNANKDLVDQAKSVGNQLIELSRNTNDASNQLQALDSTTANSKRLADEEYNARLKLLRVQQAISFAGGTRSYQQNAFPGMTQDFNNARMNLGSSSAGVRGRGALGILDQLKQLGIGPTSLPQGLVNTAQTGLEADLKKYLSSIGQNLSKEQIGQIAKTQIQNYAKQDQAIEAQATSIPKIDTAVSDIYKQLSQQGIKIDSSSINQLAQAVNGISIGNQATITGQPTNTAGAVMSGATYTGGLPSFSPTPMGQGPFYRGKLFNELETTPSSVDPLSTSQTVLDNTKIKLENLKDLEQRRSEFTKQIEDHYIQMATAMGDAQQNEKIASENRARDLQVINDKSLNALQIEQKLIDLHARDNQLAERRLKFRQDEIDHMNDLADLADGYLTSVEYANKELERQQNAARTQGYNPAIGIATNFVNAMSYNGTQFFQDLNTSAVDVANNIQESFSNAFQSFASGTVSAGDAFKNFAIQILQQIQQIATQISTKLFMGAIFGQLQGALGGMGGGGGGLGSLLGFSKGGSVKGYAGGGYVNGGSGLVDDVPAVLSKGEFVLNQRAVKSLQQAYGPGFLHSLNAGATRGMADGGGFSKNFNNEFAVTGAENTSGLNTKNMQSGLNALDAYINQLKGENNVDPNLSNYALSDPESIKNQERMQKEVDYKDYVGYLMDSYNQNTATMVSAQQAYAKELDAYNRQQKQMLQSAWMSAIMGIAGGAMMGFGGGMGGMGGLFGPKASAFAMPGGMGGTSSALGSNYGAITSLYGGAQQSGGFSSLFSSKNLPMLGMLGAGVVGSPFLQNMLKGSGTSYASSSGRTSSGLTTSNRFRFASGGMAEDDVPALLMGGEFVVNKNAVKKYGTGFFEKLNNGQVRGFADGGQVGNSILGGGTESSLNVDILTTAIADLNETLKNQKDKQTSSAGDTNNITIQISMEADGKTTENSQDNSNSSDQNDENKNSNKAAKEKNMKEFTQLIKQNVISTIIEQKRPGGLLSKTSQS
jgi:TP901 family phage tail tape measure protein